jgi:hypothetical protein
VTKPGTNLSSWHGSSNIWNPCKQANKTESKTYRHACLLADAVDGGVSRTSLMLCELADLSIEDELLQGHSAVPAARYCCGAFQSVLLGWSLL